MGMSRLRVVHRYVSWARLAGRRVKPWLMRFLVPAASATLIAAVAMSVAAAVPVTGAAFPAAGALPSSAGGQSISSPHIIPAAVTSAKVRARPISPMRVNLMTASGAPLAAPETTRVMPGVGFTWPLSPRPRVFRRFVQPLDQWSRGHRGVDLLATVNQPVLSAGNGVVAFSGVIAGRGVITIRHQSGLRTTYEPVDDRLTAGTIVHRGDRIGVVSATPGHCAPRTCLHWGAISGATYRDPLSLLGLRRPILLPLR